MFKRVVNYCLFIGAASALSAVANAQVTSIQGTVGDHQEVTIVGSGFGTKPNGSKPYAFFEFGRNQSSASSYSRNAWGAPALGSLGTSYKASGSSAAWIFNVGGGDGDVYSGKSSTGTRFKPSPAGRDLYVYYRLYMNWDGMDAASARSDWNLKGFRMWANDTSVPDIVVGYADAQSDGNPRVFAENTMSSSMYMSGVQGFLKNQWKTEEIALRQSSGNNVADAFWQQTSNGIASQAYPNLVTRTSSYPGPYTDLFWHQSERTGFSSSSGKVIAYDVVYIDDSWARVVVTDSSSWNTTTAKKVEIQVPVSWSDTKIQVLLRQGSLDSLSGKYLYVINSAGKPVSTTGFPVKSGGTVVAVPNPPTAVSVQ
jgi:hypothetical protein